MIRTIKESRGYNENSSNDYPILYELKKIIDNKFNSYIFDEDGVNELLNEVEMEYEGQLKTEDIENELTKLRNNIKIIDLGDSAMDQLSTVEEIPSGFGFYSIVVDDVDHSLNSKIFFFKNKEDFELLNDLFDFTPSY